MTSLNVLEQELGDLNNYIYYGGMNPEESDLSPDSYNYYFRYYKYYKKLKPVKIEFNNKCVCGEILKYNCYVKNIITNEVFVIGSVCIDRFIKDGKKRRCEICNSIHRNTKDNKCKICRITFKQELLESNNQIVNFGKYKNKSFDYVIKNDIGYCKWINNVCLNEINITKNMFYLNKFYIKHIK
jgi:hypothetical protein